jgi:broad specificity phosphatase PhoE
LPEQSDYNKHMTTTVILVRHGQTDSNLNDYYMGWSAEDLNETGIDQVNFLASRLSRFPIEVIYSSPLQRTLATAKIISERHKLTPEIRQNLIEMKLGSWEGLYANEIRLKWPGLFEQWRKDPSEVRVPGGENLTEVTLRSIRELNEIVNGNQDKSILIVTHEIVIKVMVPYVLGCTNAVNRRFRISNASISIITNQNGNYRLITLNDTAHLEKGL